MSFQAMAWAVEQKCANSGEKLVLVMLANYCNSHTGQCNPSQNRLAEECSMGVSTLRRHLQSLADAGLLRVDHRAVDGVSLPNQYILKVKEVPPNRMDGPSKSDGRVPPNRATNQEVKPRTEPDESFGLFWQAYPKKKDKETARKAWVKVPADLHPVVMDALAKQSQSQDWVKEAGKYVPNPATWINGKRWEDEDGGVPVQSTLGSFI